MISVSALVPEDRPALLAFHAAEFGVASYQAKPAYLTWLYDQNPAGSEASPGWIARDETGHIVGCIHVMAFAAEHEGQALRVHALHNLMVTEQHRIGVGMVLVKRALRGADIAIFPGVAPELAKTYRAIRYEEVPSFWGRRILNPIGAGTGRALARLGVVRTLPQRLSARLAEDVEQPEAVLEMLADRLNAKPDNRIRWTVETVRWRFFSGNGPRHLLCLDRARADAYCVLSVGLRHNVRVARPVAYGSDTSILRTAIAEIRRLGVEVVLGFASTDADRAVLETLRLAPVPEMPTSFLKRSAAGTAAGAFHLAPACTDLGFESL